MFIDTDRGNKTSAFFLAPSVIGFSTFFLVPFVMAAQVMRRSKNSMRKL